MNFKLPRLKPTGKTTSRSPSVADALRSPLAVRRLCLGLAILAAIGGALVLSGLRDGRRQQFDTAAMRDAWRNASAPVGGTLSLETVKARYGIRAGGAPSPGAASGASGSASAGSGELVWSAPSAAELRASLTALDATDAKVMQVKIVRNGTAYAVSAERAP